MARAKFPARTREAEAGAGGLWHQPALLNLLADLLIVLAVAALAWAALTALQRLPLFPLREIVLAAAPERVSIAQVEHAARTAATGNFFTVDLDTARRAFETLPWVRKAAVERLWPDGLRLTLEEHVAQARWRPLGQEGLTAFVNAQGEVFSVEAPEDAARLPWLSGPEGSAPELLRRHADFSATLAAIGRHPVALTLSARRAWQIKLDNGTLVELGRDQERHPLAERIARFVAHYEETRRHVGVFRVADMRYPNGFAVGGIQPPTRQDQRS